MSIKSVFANAFISLAFFGFTLSFCGPYDADMQFFDQPDGTEVPAFITGGHHSSHLVGIEGRTLIYDEQSQWICYAELSEDGTKWKSTGIHYTGSLGEGLPELNRPQKGLHLPREIVLHQELDGFSKAFPDVAKEKYVVPPEPLIGNVTGVTILIGFSDETCTVPKGHFEEVINSGPLCNGKPEVSGGSVCGFYSHNSGGKLKYLNEIMGYYTAPQTKVYYNAGSGFGSDRVQQLIKGALEWAENQGLDFNKLSLDSRSQIRAVNVYYCGNGPPSRTMGLWPHSSSMRGENVFKSSDGKVSATRYQVTSTGTRTTVRPSTMIHENGHLIGRVADLYDLEGPRGMGRWAVMASGGNSFNPYFRHFFGWDTAIDITGSPAGKVFTLAANSHTSMVWIKPNSQERFYITAVRDKDIGVPLFGKNPDDGLAIFHIDGSTRGNIGKAAMTASTHYEVSLEQADGRFNLESSNGNSGDNTDAWDKSGFSLFTGTTTPNSNWWDGSPSGFNIRILTDIGDSMSFQIVSSSSIDPKSLPQGKNFEGQVTGPNSVDLRLIQSQYLKVTLINIKGEVIQKIASRLFDSGTHALTWNSEKLAEGVYFVQIKSNSKVEWIKKYFYQFR